MIYRVGRGNDVNMRITDISVSRTHAYITMVDGKSYIEDANSKFGTLMLLQKPIALPNNDKTLAAM